MLFHISECCLSPSTATVFAVSATFWWVGWEANNRAGLLCHRCRGTGGGHGRWSGDRWKVRTGHFAGSRPSLGPWPWPTPLPERTQKESGNRFLDRTRTGESPGTSTQVRTRHTVEGETDHLSVTKGSLRSGFAPLGSGGLSILVCVCVSDWREREPVLHSPWTTAPE